MSLFHVSFNSLQNHIYLLARIHLNYGPILYPLCSTGVTKCLQGFSKVVQTWGDTRDHQSQPVSAQGVR